MGQRVPINVGPTCPKLGKTQSTRSRAKSEAKRLSRRSGMQIDAFECPYCGTWHCGKRVQKVAA